jgi:hypothetical protein
MVEDRGVVERGGVQEWEEWLGCMSKSGACRERWVVGRAEVVKLDLEGDSGLSGAHSVP